MGTRGRGIAAVITLFVLLGSAPRASAQAFMPQNDDLAQANDIGNGTGDTGPLIGATHETLAGETNDTAGDTGSVWAKWTPPADETVTASMCDPNNLSNGAFDSLLDVYNGPATNPTYSNIQHVVFNDDGCGSSNHLSAAKWAAHVGTTYYFRIDQDATTATTYVMNLEVSPPNDDFSGTAIAGAPLSITGSNVGATKEAGEPDIAGQPGGSSVWWSWTAPAAGSYVAETCNSSFNTLLAVYTGTAFNMGGLTLVQGNDDTPGCGPAGQGSLVTFSAAAAGDVFRITVDGGPGIANAPQTGTIRMDIATTPGNDALGHATAISGFPTSVTGSTLLATAEPMENTHGGHAATNSVWYRWTAPSSGPVTIDTCGSFVDTWLSVYDDGASFPLLMQRGDNDDSTTCGPQSSVYFNAVQSQVYAIAIDGVPGVVQLNIHDVTPPTTSLDSTRVKQRRRKAIFTFSGTDDRGAVTFECSLDGGAFAPCTSPFTTAKLKRGHHTFHVRAVDAAGNVDATPAMKGFRVKKPA